ncbi:hypothetical protein FRB99_007038 [Tulasnella sp. 403]|nr:hypothetical protein FRB99_007038 [Tulasnella sp. 403]
MPKVSTAAAAASGGSGREGTALRRNQACRQCRKRKLKCDAQKPFCSTCVKQWNAQIAVPPPVGFTHPSQPLCMYDHMEGLGLTPINPDNVEDPKQRIHLLETQIAELQIKLLTAQREGGVQHTQASPALPGEANPPGDPSGSRSSTSPSNDFQWLNVPIANARQSPSPHLPHAIIGESSTQHNLVQRDDASSSVPKHLSRPSSAASGPGTSSSAPHGMGHLTNITSTASSRAFPGNVDMDIDTELMNSGSAPFGFDITTTAAGNAASPFLSSYELIYSGWNPDLPEPRLLNHLVSLYFSRDTSASRILHRPTFLLAMTLPPSHPDFPHPALLHAICASASRWTSITQSTRDTKKGGRDRFAEFHAAKTRSYIDQTIATGQNIFSVLLAGIVLSWWFYSEGRWVEVWSHAGFLTRVSIPLGLNFPGTHRSHNASPYLAPPRNPTDLEQRRRAWWMCLMFDRIVSVGGWPHSIDERDIGTELPLRRVDFEAETGVPSNPQDLSSENLFTRHNPLYTDPYILFLKACMLFGRVTDYNTRMVNLRAPRSPPVFTSAPNLLSSKPNPPSGDTSTFRGDPRMAAGFRGLDRLVAVEFLANLPMGMRSCLGVQHQPGSTPVGEVGSDIDGTALDTDLYMVHIIPHAAIITLHNPYINFSDPQCPSAARCLTAARAILNNYYLITSTSFDIKRLHPFVTICWYLAAVVLVQLCRRLIEIGDRAREASVWGEINLMRLAMIEFGTVSPIGIRQEKLLQGLMADILKMTSQAQPLDVGVPLYPFSRQTLYDPTFQPTIKEVVDASNAAVADTQKSSLAGRTGERLRGQSHSHSGSGTPKITHIPTHGAPLPAPTGFDEESLPLGDLGMGIGAGMALGSATAAALEAMSMISAQGIWRPMESDVLGVATAAVGGEMHQPQNGEGGTTMDIFDQLGL